MPLNDERLMTKDDFTKILKEYDVSDEQINSLWETRPSDMLSETSLRWAIQKSQQIGIL